MTGDIGGIVHFWEVIPTSHTPQDALFPFASHLKLFLIAMTLVQCLTKIVVYRGKHLRLTLTAFQLFDTLTKHLYGLVILSHALIYHAHQLIGSCLSKGVFFLLGILKHTFRLSQGCLNTRGVHIDAGLTVPRIIVVGPLSVFLKPLHLLWSLFQQQGVEGAVSQHGNLAPSSPTLFLYVSLILFVGNPFIQTIDCSLRIILATQQLRQFQIGRRSLCAFQRRNSMAQRIYG